MLLYKCWRPLLLRMVSPQIVGLVLFCFVGGVLNTKDPPPWDDHSNTFEISQTFSPPHPTVRVRNHAAIDVLKRRYSNEDSLPFTSLPTHFTYKDLRDSSIDSVYVRHESNKSPTAIPSQPLSKLDVSKHRYTNEGALPFTSLPPHSTYKIQSDSSTDSINDRHKSNKFPSAISLQPLSELDVSKQRYSNEDVLPFTDSPPHSIYRIATDVAIDGTDESYNYDGAQPIDHSQPLPALYAPKRRYWYNDNLPFTTLRPYPIHKVTRYSPSYHRENRYRFSDTQPFLYSQPLPIRLTENNPTEISILKRVDLYNGTSSRSPSADKVNRQTDSTREINENSDVKSLTSLQASDIYRINGHVRLYPTKRRKTFNDTTTLLSHTDDKIKDHTLLFRRKQGYAYNDTPPLNPTFNAKRYKKPETSAKIADDRDSSLQYKQASSLNARSDLDDMTIGESYSGNVKFSDRENTPLLYKAAFKLQAEAELETTEKPTILSLPNRINGHWKNLKRLNSGRGKLSPRTESGFEDSLNVLVDNSRNNVPLVTDKMKDNDLLKLLDRLYDKKYKKHSISKPQSNYTKSGNKNRTGSLDRTSQVLETVLNNTFRIIDGNHISINMTEFPLPKTRNRTFILFKSQRQLNATTNNKTRQGRNRILFNPESTRIIINNKTAQNALPNKLRNASNLFNYTYHISAMERGSLFPHDPFDDNKDFGKRSLFSSGYSIPLSDNASVDTTSKKPSVYEVLRPRLRQPSMKDDTWEDRLTTLTSLKPHSRHNSEPYEKVPLNLNEEDVNMSTSNTDAIGTLKTIQNKTEKLDSSNDLSKRVDSMYTPESLLKSLKNITSFLSRPSSRRIPDTNDNVPVREIAGSRNGSQILKRQRFYNGVRRQLNPLSNTTRSPMHVFRETKERTSTVATVDFNTNTPPTTTIITSIVTSISEDANTIFLKSSEASTTPDQQFSTGYETTTQLPESDLNRRPKMTDKTNSENDFKRPKLSSKTFYDYLMKAAERNASYNFSLPEFRPGNFYRYDGIYPRKPVLDSSYSRPPPFFKVRTSTRYPVTEVPDENHTTFESKRTSIRVSSTFYPNRMQDVTMRFGNNLPTTPAPRAQTDDEDEPDDADEFRDPLTTGFTMEKLAYLLIGTCCGLSVLCLCVVVVAIKCRRHLVEKRIKAHFRSRMYPHHDPRTIKDDPWLHQQMYDHFFYPKNNNNNIGLHPDSSRSSANSCNCHCVTWSLGARNLETSSRPTPSTNRSSLYLCGQKKLPFGAASTLRFESRKRQTITPPPVVDSSPESDSLEHDSSESSECPKRCTCISYNMWSMPGDVRRGMYGMCPGHYVVGDCSHHQQQQDDGEPIPRDCPPPVTGSNYLDRSEGVVFWSSNDERLI